VEKNLTPEQIQILKEHIIVYQLTTVEAPPLIVISEAHLLSKHRQWTYLNLPQNIELFEVRVTVYTLEGEHIQMISEICNKQTVKNRLNYIPLKLKAQLIDL
jgi:hypothetical protein